MTTGPGAPSLTADPVERSAPSLAPQQAPGLAVRLTQAVSVGTLKLAFLLGGIALVSGLYAWFFVQIWEAHGGTPPDLSSQAVYAASLIGGGLGTAFAVAVGIQRQSPKTNEKTLNLGPTLLQGGWQTVLGRLASASTPSSGRAPL